MKYAASDQINVAKYGAVFDADGTITNYEQVMKNIVDEYNRAVDTYNNSAQEDGDKEALEQAEQRFEDAKKAIEDYEEAIATANEAANEMLEIQNKISEIETEKITYILEYKVEMNERDLAKLEYYQDKYADDLERQGDVYAAIYGSMLEYESNLAAISEAMAELDRKRRDGLINDEDYAETLAELYD
jgi:F0F1-type ATP synthase membrane subunit b/b'